MNHKVIHLAIAAIASASFAGASAQSVSDFPDIDRYVYPGNMPASAPAITFLSDGKSYARLSDDRRRITRHDIASGQETEVMLDLGHTRQTTLQSIKSFTVSPDGSRIMVLTESTPVYRRSFTGKYYVYEVRSRILRPLSTNHPTQQSPVFSPDSRMVAFVDSCNIFIKKLDYDTEVAVTRDGRQGSIINGIPDWTYEEEFTTTCSMAWSPDNMTLCYLRYDESAVPTYSLPLYQGACNPMDEYALYPGALSYKYPVAGEPNSKVSLHSYDVETRKSKLITLPDSRIEYIPRIAFASDPGRLIVTTLNRDQNRMEIYSANPRSTVCSSLLVEENPSAWLDPRTYEDITLMPESMVIHSSRSGFNHLYEYSYSGTLLRQITTGDYDVTAYYGYNASRQTHYYQAASTGAANRVISSVDKKGRVTDLTPGEGTANGIFTPDMSHYMLTFSTITSAPEVTLHDASGKKLRTMVDNSAYARAYASDPVREFMSVSAGSQSLNAMMVKPAGFDPSKRYPMIINQYSGPGSQEVLNRWNADWTIYFARQGYIVVTIDPRGTGGRGRAFMDAVYRNLGEAETADLTAAARSLSELPFVDGTRIGIYGWSFGGYEALMCATDSKSPFSAAVAVAPVTDWRLYDTAYTERYMLTPAQNPDGYAAGAPLNRVSNLKSRLLLMWGTADDNVHPANSLEFISRLHQQGKWAETMEFPNQNHSINGCRLRSVVYARMLDFFNRNL